MPAGRSLSFPVMSYTEPARRPDPAAVALTLAAQALLGAGLLYGMIADTPVADRIEEAIGAINLDPPPPPPPAPPPRPEARDSAAKRAEGAAAPPNLTARATPVVAPKPVIRVPVPPPPIAAAPVPAAGTDTSQGNAPTPGPGTGAGGVGTGTGAGASGDGPGGGGAGNGGRQRPAVLPRKIAGRIYSGRDYPSHLAQAGIGGHFFARWVVDERGMVRDCRMVDSTGNAELDAHTCALITARYRYRPGLNAAGDPIAVQLGEEGIWLPRPDE